MVPESSDSSTARQLNWECRLPKRMTSIAGIPWLLGRLGNGLEYQIRSLVDHGNLLLLLRSSICLCTVKFAPEYCLTED